MSELNEYLNNAARKKRLGQYFTDDNIVSLLLELSNVNKNDKIIDPMAGLGNMLLPLINKGHDPDKIFGIEIDPIAGEICHERLNINNFVIGDAFNEISYNKFKSMRNEGWDLVITNPPYVRYQSMGTNDDDIINLPDANHIRQGLIKTIDSFYFLNKYDKLYFKDLAKSYSGLSDLAVPSWILCASMLKVGGKLAIIVPDTWLNREYALIVQYILFKWFKIEYIVEDVNRVWFSDAQVKTNLIIASRINRINSINSINNYDYRNIKIYGNKKFKIGTDTNSFSKKELEIITRLNTTVKSDNFSLESRMIDNMLSNFIRNNKKDWLYRLEGKKDEEKNLSLPYELVKLLGISKTVKTISLEDLGLNIGQGLRTGANVFFYLTSIETLNDYEIVESSKRMGYVQFKANPNILYKVIRKQSDLSDGLVISSESIKGRVLYIQDSVTKKDIDNTDDELISDYSLLDDDISGFINKASRSSINDKDPEKLIPTLSAVKPNIRIEKKDGIKKKRFWYMLPTLTERHTPELFIPRINNNSPNTYLIDEAGIVVDANFSTLWVDDSNKKNKLAYFAILNSLWVKAYLECISTVMGGGALKVEASHVKKIKIPVLDEKDYKLLNHYGMCLSKAYLKQEKLNIINAIDDLILNKINNNNSDNYRNLLRKFVENKIGQRKK